MRKFILLFTIIAIIFSFIPDISVALTAREVQEQIKKTNEQIAQIEKEIEVLSKQIAETSLEKNTLANAIKELNFKRNQLIKEREAIQKKINATGLVIQSIDSDIGEKEKSLTISRLALANSLRKLYQNDNTLFIERLLSGEKLSDFSREYNNLLAINQEVKNKIFEILDKKEKLLASKNEKELERQNLNNLKKNLSQQEKVIDRKSVV